MKTRNNRKYRKDKKDKKDKKASRKSRKSSRKGLVFTRQRGGSFLPTSTWGSWSSNPAATAWGPDTQAPPPLANGGLINAPQSTGPWASIPMPATQHAFALEAAKVSGLPEVAYHQNIGAGTGNNFSPYIHAPLSSSHYSAGIPPQQ